MRALVHLGSARDVDVDVVSPSDRALPETGRDESSPYGDGVAGFILPLRREFVEVC